RRREAAGGRHQALQGSGGEARLQEIASRDECKRPRRVGGAFFVSALRSAQPGWTARSSSAGAPCPFARRASSFHSENTGSRLNTRWALPPRMLRLAFSSRNFRS